jgi:hypothetical protein
MKFSIKAIKKSGEVCRYQKGNLKRFAQIFEAKLFRKWVISVTYGKGKDIFNREVEYRNDGEYTNGHEAYKAFRSFIDG